MIAVLMLLKKHGRMTAAAIAAELGVSERTVLRDIDSLSLSGVPVYAERGRGGGFTLLPGYRTDLTGLTVDEATSLLAGSGRMATPAFASAMRKVAAAVPDAYRDRAVRAAQRVLVRPEGFVRAPQELDSLSQVAQAVFDGRRMRMTYRRPGVEPRERVVDPIGLIVAGDTWYLVANSRGAERMYRVSRMSDVEVLDERADRSEDVDLDDIWQRRRSEFRASFDAVDVVIDCAADDVENLGRHTSVLSVDVLDSEGGTRLSLRFEDRRHAVRALWAACYDSDCEVVDPAWVRDALAARATAVAGRHATPRERRG
nr:WYL domain-containing protein [Gordonia sp. SID5947]